MLALNQGSEKYSAHRRNCHYKFIVPFSSEDTWWGKYHLLQTVAVFGNEMFTKSINGVTLRILEMVARVTIILTRERRLLPAVSPPRKRICFTLKRLRYFQNGIRLILGFRFNQFSDKR